MFMFELMGVIGKDADVGVDGVSDGFDWMNELMSNVSSNAGLGCTVMVLSCAGGTG